MSKYALVLTAQIVFSLTVALAGTADTRAASLQLNAEDAIREVTTTPQIGPNAEPHG